MSVRTAMTFCTTLYSLMSADIVFANDVYTNSRRQGMIKKIGDVEFV